LQNSTRKTTKSDKVVFHEKMISNHKSGRLISITNRIFWNELPKMTQGISCFTVQHRGRENYYYRQQLTVNKIPRQER